MLKRLLLVLVASVTVASGMTTGALAKENKGGHYYGGEGSSHKGGVYVPPYGRRYEKKDKGSQHAPEAKPATPTPSPSAGPASQ